MAKWKFSVSTANTAPNTAPILLKGSISENLETAYQMGYSGIEVHLRETDILDYDSIYRTMEKTKVEVSSVVTGRLHTEGGVNLMDDRPYITDYALEGMESYIDIASKLKTNIVVGWIRGNVPKNGDREKYLSILGRNLRKVCESAEKRNVKVFLEIINRYEINVFNTARETLEFIKKWELPNCFIHLDTFHMGIDEVDPIEAIRQSGDLLGYFHVADNSRTYPGLGVFPFKTYLKTLEEIKYKGFVTVECLPIPDGKTAAKEAISYLKDLSV